MSPMKSCPFKAEKCANSSILANRLNANELDINFLESIKKLFPEKSININISIAEDETDYLLSHSTNASRLLKA